MPIVATPITWLLIFSTYISLRAFTLTKTLTLSKTLILSKHFIMVLPTSVKVNNHRIRIIDLPFCNPIIDN